METWKDVEKDWSSLPPEVLNLIAKYLYEIIDFVRFRAVSKAWRSATPITDLPPQFPWICDGRYSNEETDLRFFSIPSNKIYTIHVSKAMNKMLGEACDGYYFARLKGSNYRIRKLSLINPLNNDEILLPACAKDIPIRFGHGVNQIGEHVVYCVFLTLYSERKFLFCYPGHECWCELKLDSDIMWCYVIFSKGMIFTIEYDTGITKITDSTSGTLLYVVPPIESHLTILGDFDVSSHSYKLVGASDDNQRIFVCDEASYDAHHLNLTNIDFPCWVKLKNIGDYAIFMDESNCFMLKANDLVGIKANCIYVLKDDKYVELYNGYLYEVERINIETSVKDSIRCPFLKKGGNWFVPNLHHLCVK